MTRDEQEMALWREAYVLAMSRCLSAAESADAADAIIEHFRQRYPPQPHAPEAVWYDEPPFEKSLDDMFSAWITDYPYPVMVAYFRDGWAYQVPNRGNHWTPLNGRRVCPITKPPEPTT